MREVLDGLRPALADDAVVVLVIGDVERDRGRHLAGGVGLAERVWAEAALPAGYRLAGVALDDVAAGPQDDQAVGRRGRAGDEARPDPGPGRDRGGPPPGPQRGRDAGRLGLATAPPARRLGRCQPGLRLGAARALGATRPG